MYIHIDILLYKTILLQQMIETPFFLAFSVVIYNNITFARHGGGGGVCSNVWIVGKRLRAPPACTNGEKGGWFAGGKKGRIYTATAWLSSSSSSVAYVIYTHPQARSPLWVGNQSRTGSRTCRYPSPKSAGRDKVRRRKRDTKIVLSYVSSIYFIIRRG